MLEELKGKKVKMLLYRQGTGGGTIYSGTLMDADDKLCKIKTDSDEIVVVNLFWVNYIKEI